MLGYEKFIGEDDFSADYIDEGKALMKRGVCVCVCVCGEWRYILWWEGKGRERRKEEDGNERMYVLRHRIGIVVRGHAMLPMYVHGEIFGVFSELARVSKV